MPKKTQNKPKKASPAKRALKSALRAGVSLLENPSIHESVLTGLTDPFSPESALARYPDAGAGATLTERSRYTNICTTFSVSGAYAACFTPVANFATLAGASATNTTVTWGAAGTNDLSTTMLNTYGYYYRPTSMGVRIFNTLSATASAGYLIIAKGGPPPLGGTTTFDPANFTSYEIFPFVHGGEWHAVSKPRHVGAYTMSQVSSAIAIATRPSEWESVYIGYFGGPVSTSALGMEVVLNYEYVPKEDAAIAQYAAPQPVLDINMQTAVNAVQSSHSGVHAGPNSNARNTIKRHVKSALIKHVLPFAVKKGKQLLL
jgi:hypothetical protein